MLRIIATAAIVAFIMLTPAACAKYPVVRDGGVAVETLDNPILSLAEKLAEAKQKLAESGRKHKAAEERTLALEAERYELRGRLEAKNQETDLLRKQVSELENRLAGADRLVATLLEEKETRQAVLRLLREALDAATQSRNALNTENAALVAELKRVLGELAKANEGIAVWTDKMQKSLDALELERTGWAQRALASAKETLAYKKQLQAAQAEKEKMRQERDALLRARGILETDKSTLGTELQNTQAQLAIVTKNLKATQKKLAATERTLYMWRLSSVGSMALLLFTVIYIAYVYITYMRPKHT